ncbi:MAG: hypothetical protein QT07_C0001G0016 [archaeon GW2011_AR16]|nr:MAG: hypothetical protein QT07_C0001G0016 [archaeon GW2011_AR16]
MKRRGHLLARRINEDIMIKDLDGNLYDLGQPTGKYGNFLEDIEVTFRVNEHRKAIDVRRIPVKKFRRHALNLR